MYSVERISFQSSCLRHGHSGRYCCAEEELTLLLFTKAEESINELFCKEDSVIKKIAFPQSSSIRVKSILDTIMFLVVFFFSLLRCVIIF